MIDNAYISLSETATFQVLDESLTDHFPILVNWSKSLAKEKLKTIYRRDIKRVPTSDLEAALGMSDWSKIFDIHDPNEAVDLLINNVNEALDIVAPVQEIKIRPNKPKISLKRDTLAAMASRDNARKSGNRKHYKILRNTVNKLVKRDKIQSVMKNLMNNPGPQQSWQEAKNFLGRGRGAKLPECTTNSDPESTAEHQNEFFINKVAGLVASTQVHEIHKPYDCDICHEKFSNAHDKNCELSKFILI